MMARHAFSRHRTECNPLVRFLVALERIRRGPPHVEGACRHLECPRSAAHTLFACGAAMPALAEGLPPWTRWAATPPWR